MEVSDYTFSIPQEILDNQDLGHEFTMTDEAMQVLAKFIVDHPELDNEEKCLMGMEEVCNHEYFIQVPWIGRSMEDAAYKVKISGHAFVMGVMTKWSLFLKSLIFRADSLNTAFMSLVKENNLLAALPLIRLQLDNCMLSYAGTKFIVPDELAEQYEQHVRLSKIKDKSGVKLTEMLLSTELDKYFKGFRSAYIKACEFVHLSQEHLAASYQLNLEDKSLKYTWQNFNGLYSEAEQTRYKTLMLSANNVLLNLIIFWVRKHVELNERVYEETGRSKEHLDSMKVAKDELIHTFVYQRMK